MMQKSHKNIFIIGGIVVLAVVVFIAANFVGNMISGGEKTSSGNVLMSVAYDHEINESSIYASDLDVLWDSQVLGSDYYARYIQSVIFLDSLDNMPSYAWYVL
ncbi:MAG: hypothetical protein LUG12_02370 [Erysipelotrichaceae bacterium]|nr:hypothetical protein [Erysipelotrichaceae bacterium]